MKRVLVVVLCAGLVAGSLTGPAQSAPKRKKPKKIERVVDFAYQCPCVGLYQLGGLTGGDPNLGGGVIAVGAGEVFLTAEVTDASGRPVGVSINQDTDGDGLNNDVGAFCGKTETPISIVESLELRVFMGETTATCPGPALGGAVKFTFSNMP